ncbi:SAM-dependent methyltransferase [Spirillospora sp. NBC_00431]
MTQGPAPGPTVRSAPGPRADEAGAHGPLLTAPAPGVAHRHTRFLGGGGDRAADRDPAGRPPRRRPTAGRIFQANRGFLDHAAVPPARDTGPRRFPDLGGGLRAPANLGGTPAGAGGTRDDLGGTVRRTCPDRRTAALASHVTARPGTERPPP